MDMPDSQTGGDPVPGSAFPHASHEQWRSLVAGVLKKSGVEVGPDASEPEAMLASATYDGITLSPLYTPEDGLDSGFPGLAPFTRGGRPEGAAASGWEVRQLHADPDPARTRGAVLADLENGVGALWLRVGDGGLPPSGLREALTDVYLDMAPVHLEPGADHRAAADALLGVWADAGADSGATGGLGIDPLGTRMRGRSADLADAAATARGHADRHPRLLLMAADATPVHDAGGSEAQELGTAMAVGTAYLRALTEAGMGLAEAAGRIEFRLAASADQFLTIAKLRAARAMWARVCEACHLTEEHRSMRLHAVTSAAMMTRRDPYVNMLRTTLACFGAGVGGADAVTVRPFDSALGLPDGFARRIARNTQSLLVEEAGLARVIDPAGGSFFVERLTADLYAKGWAFFQELEAAGGLPRALDSGLLRDRVDEVWERRRDAVAHRADPVTGVSEFPLLTEELLEREPAPAPRAEEAERSVLPARRYAEEFEELRDAADAHRDATGARPAVFLVTLGPVAAHTARAAFAANLLQAGGIEPVGGGTTGGPDEAAAAFAEAGAQVACLCSSDALYDEHAAEAVEALRRAGARRVLLAGTPDGEHRAAGADGFLHAGADALGLLKELHETLGVGR
ncbi:methylmalonyl-CoA mutase subunit beta [Nocardiopsis sp. RSe5-2]|uniref:methylmalonyl-CoA mutase n=1 Tax=Nocardiopsis endophytica TaxID=3018445 RepID=A0ABT4UAX5_9ACTN|nr:methylmalonyl-CoA mutase subunit beta [Nocardiopsis endophytica]MDA2814120.1 methylmalonyl-CoA mutase subunit beta [Nocardiopsis endophytica]